MKLDARIIAATNQDIQAAIKQGSLRKDLYYRLNVLSIVVPPLRERKSDIPALIHAFMDRYGWAEGRVTGISNDVMQLLMNYLFFDAIGTRYSRSGPMCFQLRAVNAA